MKRVALYVRVSTEEQQKNGLSVDAQIQALQNYALAHNYYIVDVFNDAGISARKSYKKRPALLKMIKACQMGKIDLILFTKLDRFFRSVGDYYAVMEQIGNISWKAIDEDYETETSSGIFKVNIMLSIAQSEADRTSERIKSTFEYKKSMGEVCSGNSAIGYVVQDKKWHKDESQRQAVEKFFEHYLATFKFKESYELAVSYGLKSTYRASLSFINNNCYCGEPAYVTEPYITKEEFDTIQKHKQYHPRACENDYTFKGILLCGLCGSPLSGKSTRYFKNDGTERVIVQYICSRHCHQYPCTGSTISEKNLENYLMNQLDAEMNKYNVLLKSKRNEYDEKIIASLKGKFTRLKNMYELGDVEFDEYKKKREEILSQIKKYEDIPKMQMRSIPSNWKEMYYQLDIPHRNAFWIASLDYIEVTGRKCKTPNIFF